MKRLFGILSLCIGVLTFLTALAITLGHAQTQAMFIPELQRCDDLVCYLGILPGTTAWEQGMTIIRQTSQLKISAYPPMLLRRNPDYTIGLLSRNKDNNNTNPLVVGEINIGIDGPIYAADAIIKLGPPCYVLAFDDQVGLGYPNAIFSLTVSNNTLAPDSRIKHILLRQATASEPCATLRSSSGPATYRWQGFRGYPK